jgi:hypothetical protein
MKPSVQTPVSPKKLKIKKFLQRRYSTGQQEQEVLNTTSH